MSVYKYIPLLILFLLPTETFAIQQITNASVQTSSENAEQYLTAPSPVVGTCPPGLTCNQFVLFITYDKDTGTQVGAAGVSTFATWPITPYDWSISLGTIIPISPKISDLSSGNYRTFVCQLEDYNCGSQDWGGSSYPTYNESNNNSLAYYVDFSINNGQLTVGGVNNTYQTRFIDAIPTFTAFAGSFDVSYFLELTEYTNLNRPDTVDITTYNSAGTPELTATVRQLILPLNDGTSTSTITLSVGGAGIFTSTFRFFNINSQTFTFQRANIVVQFEIDGSGDLVDYDIVDNSDGTIPIANLTTYTPVPCGITAIDGCIQNALAFLFIPQPSSYDKITSLFSESTFPFVANVYTAYASFEEGLENPDSPEVLSYSLSIPEAGIDVEMFSVAQIEYLMGDTKPVFRSLVLLVLIVGFLTMLITTINRMLFFTEYITKN